MMAASRIRVVRLFLGATRPLARPRLLRAGRVGIAPTQQLCVFVSDKLPGKIAFEKAALLKQLSNHLGGWGEKRILPFVQPCFSCLLIGERGF